jgi:hypothetical protein
MRIALALGLLIALGIVSGANGDENLEPSPIPPKLQGEAKKAFAKKLPYFIWIEEKMVTAKDLKLRYATHPDQKAEPASTVIRLIRTVRGMNVPWAGYSQGIATSTTGPSDLKGTVEATIYLIKEDEQVQEEKAAAISNPLKVKVKFE